MKNEESRTELGTISIHKNVISSIASIAASEIEGVKEVGLKPKIGLLELIGKINKRACGIKVDFDKNNEVSLIIPLVVKYGYNVPEIANKVQENITSALEKMTNLSVRDVNINIRGIERG